MRVERNAGKKAMDAATTANAPASGGPASISRHSSSSTMNGGRRLRTPKPREMLTTLTAVQGHPGLHCTQNFAEPVIPAPYGAPTEESPVGTLPLTVGGC